jgi:hypothetical protein
MGHQAIHLARLILHEGNSLGAFTVSNPRLVDGTNRRLAFMLLARCKAVTRPGDIHDFANDIVDHS